MIVEFVQFKYPPGWTREQILEDARTSVPRWRGNKELVRKHYIAGEDGTGGAFYIWPSKEAAQRGHNAEWLANIKARTGSVADDPLFRSDDDRRQRGRPASPNFRRIWHRKRRSKPRASYSTP